MSSEEMANDDRRPFTGAVHAVLLVDDDALQLKLGRMRLVDAGFAVETASGADEALTKAKLRTPDVVLSDVLMGDLDGFGLCRILRAEASLASVPVILLSAHYDGTADEQLAISVGASALIARTPDFAAELRAVRASLVDVEPRGAEANDRAVYERHLRTNATQMTKLLGRARSAEERYRLLFENADDTITILTTEGVILEANERWRQVLGIPPDEMIGRRVEEFAAPGREEVVLNKYEQSLVKGTGRATAVPLKRVDGATIYMEFSVKVIEIDGRSVVFSIGRDVTDQVVSEQRLAAAENKYRSLVERIPEVIWTCTEDGSITFMTPNVSQVLGYTAQEMRAAHVDVRSEGIHPDDRLAVRNAFEAFTSRGTPFDLHYRRQRKDGEWVWLRNRAIASYERDGVRHVEGMLSDVTEQKRLQDTLRQSQKMEAIGQLTGGIAHDFNNILAAILANSHFLLEDLAAHDPRHADAEEIKRAAERAAALTRQLLAFSRRQVLEPTIVDLNSITTGLEKMLRRLIGEDIEFTVVPGASLGSVRVDIGQVEQVVMNLVVNARDAMPAGGKLTIETSNVELSGEERNLDLDNQCGGNRVAIVPGKYVMLAVTDTGTGMDHETKRRIFEPFFTTKEPGKGTGLGLSTCYGIVKQSGGYIWVYSEPGHGTVFKVYLPCVDERPEKRPRLAGKLDVAGTETILLVEDDERVRTAVSRMLEPRGYRLLVARNGREAIELQNRHEGTIHLVLSDVIMPGANGPEVVAQVQARSSAVRALFMSGYTDHAILRSGALNGGMNFIQKPFAPETLAKKVREVLDA